MIDRDRLSTLLDDERAMFADRNPLAPRPMPPVQADLFGGVPMTWMAKSAGGFPLFFDGTLGQPGRRPRRARARRLLSG